MAPRKRKVAPVSVSFNSDTKRAKISASQPQDILIIEDSDEDDPKMQDKSPKQSATAGSKDIADVLELDDDNVEDPELQEILAQIKAQEESERFAKQLQEEYDNYTGLDGESSKIEIPGPPSSAKVASTSNGATGVSTKQTRWQARKNGNVLVRPDQSLEPFRDLFIGSRKCTNCGKQVKSPKGYVRSGSLFSSIIPMLCRSSFPSLLFPQA